MVDAVTVEGSWIWHADGVAAPQEARREGANLQDAPLYTTGAHNFYLLVRVPFELERAQRVTVHLSANNHYMAHLDGDWLGRGPAAADPSYAYLDRYTTDGELSPGHHVLAVMAFNQGVGAPHPQFQMWDGPGGCLAEVRGDDGALIAATTPGTAVRRAPHLQRGTDPLRTTVWGFEEVWNLTLEPTGWRQVDFDDSGWDAGVPAQFAPATVYRREAPPLTGWDAVPARVLTVAEQGGSISCALDDGTFTLRASAAEPGSWPFVTLDFGREVVGYPEFEIEGADGFMIVSYGETLEVERCDTLVPGRERARWSPYHRRAFRFMRLEFAQFPQVRIHGLRMRCVNADIQLAGAFECDDQVLADTWDFGRYTLLTASQDYYEADAWRERAIWLCGVEHRIASVTYGVDDVLRESLRQLARIQQPEGFLPATGPVSNTTVLPEVPVYWILALQESTCWSGDGAIARELYPTLVRLMEWYEREAGDGGLLDVTGKPWWVWTSWARLDRRGLFAPLNFRYHDALRRAAWLADFLDEGDRASHWRSLAQHVRTRCRGLFFDADRGVYVDCVEHGEPTAWYSQQTNSLATICGVAGEEGGAAVVRTLDPALLPSTTKPFMAINDLWGGWYSTVVDHTGYGEPNGANFGARIGYCQSGFDAAWLAEALFQTGSDERALSVIRQYWGGMLERNATAGWELFDPYTQRSAVPHRTSLGARFRNSHCHVYANASTYLLSRYVLGAHIAEPGGRRVAVSPQCGDLRRASGVVPLRHGDLGITWERDGDELAVSVDVPEGTTVEVGSGGHARVVEAKGTSTVTVPVPNP